MFQIINFSKEKFVLDFSIMWHNIFNKVIISQTLESLFALTKYAYGIMESRLFNWSNYLKLNWNQMYRAQ
jgi:hypothetical protein